MAAPPADARQSPASFTLTDVSVQAGLTNPTTGAHGICVADDNGDGLPDIFVTYNDIRMGQRRNFYYRNLGGGAFREEALSHGTASQNKGTHGCAWADLDNDGDYDLLQGITHLETEVPAPNRLFRNNGTGDYTLLTPPAMAAQSWMTRAILAPDLNSDGFADIMAVTGWQGSLDPPDERNEIYSGSGNLAFTASTASPFLTATLGQGGTDTDYDNDGDVDFIGCDNTGPLAIFQNNGGQLSAANAPAIGFQNGCYSGVTPGDVDNDGDMDFFLMGNAPGKTLHYYLNNGNGTFRHVVSVPGAFGFMAGLADLNNDGNLDVVIPGAPAAFLGDGNGGFVTGPALPSFTVEQDVRSVGFLDMEGDGDLDVLFASKRGRVHILRNSLASSNRWLKVRLVSPQGQAGAFGARVQAFQAGTTNLLAMREARSNYGYLVQDDPVLHLGLGAHASVDLVVTFLGGATVNVSGASTNQLMDVDGTGGTILLPPGAPLGLASTVSGSTVTFSWQHPFDGGEPASYIIEAGSAPGATNLSVVDVGNTMSTTAGVPPGLYYVRMRARNQTGTGPASNEAVVDVGGCSAPTLLASAVSSQTVSLSWQGASSGYRLEAGSAPGLSNLAQLSLAGTSLTFPGIPPGRYYLRVRGNGACGLTAASNEVAVTVQ